MTSIRASIEHLHEQSKQLQELLSTLNNTANDVGLLHSDLEEAYKILSSVTPNANHLELSLGQSKHWRDAIERAHTMGTFVTALRVYVLSLERFAKENFESSNEEIEIGQKTIMMLFEKIGICFEFFASCFGGGTVVLSSAAITDANYENSIRFLSSLQTTPALYGVLRGSWFDTYTVNTVTGDIAHEFNYDLSKCNAYTVSNNIVLTHTSSGKNAVFQTPHPTWWANMFKSKTEKHNNVTQIQTHSQTQISTPSLTRQTPTTQVSTPTLTHNLPLPPTQISTPTLTHNLPPPPIQFSTPILTHNQTQTQAQTQTQTRPQTQGQTQSQTQTQTQTQSQTQTQTQTQTQSQTQTQTQTQTQAQAHAQAQLQGQLPHNAPIRPMRLSAHFIAPPQISKPDEGPTHTKSMSSDNTENTIEGIVKHPHVLPSASTAQSNITGMSSKQTLSRNKPHNPHTRVHSIPVWASQNSSIRDLFAMAEPNHSLCVANPVNRSHVLMLSKPPIWAQERKHGLLAAWKKKRHNSVSAKSRTTDLTSAMNPSTQTSIYVDSYYGLSNINTTQTSSKAEKSENYKTDLAKKDSSSSSEKRIKRPSSKNAKPSPSLHETESTPPSPIPTASVSPTNTQTLSNPDSAVLKKKLLIVKEWCISTLETIDARLETLNQRVRTSTELGTIAAILRAFQTALEPAEKMFTISNTVSPCPYTDAVAKAKYTISSIILRLRRISGLLKTAVGKVTLEDRDALNKYVACIKQANNVNID